jgi:hypothetical protein
VKNGDRWTVLTTHRDGGLRVQHRRSGRTIQLPTSYVRDFVELGYATTIHTAQGITADTMHGLITGSESRQQLYTMCTRGRLSNPHLPATGRRRRPPHPDPARQHPALHRNRAARTDPCPRRRPKIRHHSAARPARSRPTARPLRRTLHRRPAPGRRARRRYQCGADTGVLRKPVGARASR